MNRADWVIKLVEEQRDLKRIQEKKEAAEKLIDTFCEEYKDPNTNRVVDELIFVFVALIEHKHDLQDHYDAVWRTSRERYQQVADDYYHRQHKPFFMTYGEWLTPVEEAINLSRTRVLALRKYGIDLMCDFDGWDKDALLSCYGIKERTFDTIVEELSKHGWQDLISEEKCLFEPRDPTREESELSLRGDLGISHRWAVAFAKAGIEKVADLVGYTENDLLHFDGIGPKAIEELRSGLEKYGLHPLIANDDQSFQLTSDFLDLILKDDFDLLKELGEYDRNSTDIGQSLHDESLKNLDELLNISPAE